MIGVYSRPKPGEVFNGDGYFFKENDGTVVLMVVDGLGHGELANKASNMAISYIEENLQRDIEFILKGCHERLKGTRGAVAGVAKIDLVTSELSYGGVGNIEAFIFSGGHMTALLSTNGIAGYNLRKVKIFVCPFYENDLLLIHSDGVSSRTDFESFESAEDLNSAAHRIVKEYGKDHDDATILLFRR